MKLYLAYPYFLFVLTWQCFSGAHGQTGKMEEEDLPTGAQKYRYRVAIDQPQSTRPTENGRKRTGEPLAPARRVFKRVPIIELSSDGDSPSPGEPRASTSAAPVQQITPITVDSTDEETTVPVVGSGMTEEEVFESLFGDIDMEEVMEGTSSAGTSQETIKPSLDKGKGKEKDAATDPAVFDLQEELECIICCKCSNVIYADRSDIINRSLYLFALRSRRLWTLWYAHLVLRLTCSLSMA
jgi:hypothetical protein